jgi:lipoate-protein ligase A
MLKTVEKLTLIRQGFSDHPGMDVAVSHATLSAAGRGDLESTFRLHVPGAVLAFGRADRVQAGYQRAVRVARAHRYEPVERLAGGRAAVFHESTLAFSWALPDSNPRAGIRQRFEEISGVMATAFKSLGLDARVGEIPGEYCPGGWSVNIGGRVKVMGVGQRLVRGAAHIGGVVVVDGARDIRNVLIPVYRALKLDWDPRTAGALADRSPGLDNRKVTKAIIAALSERYDVHRGELPDHVVQEAKTLLPGHLPKAA